ncbi:Hypothetical protein D9617_52g060350 [Elsinoe fawcettii]|nr:Hypothetical protein D9617_52g060350 [Elsinoe fawcettii]
MLGTGLFTNQQIADSCSISKRSVMRYKANLRLFGSAESPYTLRGPLRLIDPIALSALLQVLIYKPTMSLDEMGVYLYDQYGVAASLPTVHRASTEIGWSRKATRRVAAQRCQELRDAHQLVMSQFDAHQLVFMDESGCDERIGIRKMGWSPERVAPAQTISCDRGQRVHILPAHTVNGVLTADVYTGFTDEDRCSQWLEEQVLPLCGRFPEANLVLIMDNASFHRSDRITELLL